MDKSDEALLVGAKKGKQAKCLPLGEESYCQW